MSQNKPEKDKPTQPAQPTKPTHPETPNEPRPQPLEGDDPGVPVGPGKKP